MEIKKREVIASVVIVALMLIIGFAISEKIRQNLLEDYQVYDTAAQIDNNRELFEYGIKTNIGYTFVYGELKTLDPISYPEVSGKYSYIKKEEQEYIQHFRPVPKFYTDSKGKTHEKTEQKAKQQLKFHFLMLSLLIKKFHFRQAIELKLSKLATIKEMSTMVQKQIFKGHFSLP